MHSTDSENELRIKLNVSIDLNSAGLLLLASKFIKTFLEIVERKFEFLSLLLSVGHYNLGGQIRV